MTEIVVARDQLRTATDTTVRQAVQNHRDPDGVAQILADARDSNASGKHPDRTLDEFGSGD